MANTIKVSKIDFFRAVFIFCLITIIFSNWVPAQDKSPDPLARYRVFSLKHIPAEQGKALLEQLGIGTVSRLPNSNTLLVTASGKDFTKASAILELIDSEEKYIVQIISSASETEYFPTNEQIEKEFDAGVSIGTFDNPPSNLVPERILIDSHKDMVMAFVREEFSENIFSAIERLSTTEETSQAIPEPNISPATIEVVEVNENDEFFKKLLESLDEAEQKASKLKLAPQPSDEARSKIIKLKKEKPESAISAALKEKAEIETVAEQTTADEQELEAFLSTLSEASSPDEPIEASAKQATEGDTKKIQPKSGIIKIRDKNGDKKTELKPLQYQEDKEGYRPVLPAKMREEVKINLPSKLNITDLLTLVGEYLELDFMYDPKKVKGEAMLKFRGPIRVQDLYPLMESVLKFHGFVMTRKESLVTIVPVAEALTYDPEIYSEPNSVKVGDVIITRIFELEHIDTTSAKNFLQRMKLGASIEEIAATKTLIVTEYAYRMSRIEELLKMVDQPGKPKKFRYRRLQYTLAPSLLNQVKDLADKLGTVSITIGAGAKPAPQQPAVRGRTPAQRPTPTKPSAQAAKPAASKAVDTGVYMIADERTNRILMIGLDEDLGIVEDIISALDVEKEDLRMLRLYEIQNVGAEDVANKLRDLGIISVVPTSGARGRTQTSRGRISTTAPRPAQQRPGTPQQQQQQQTTDAASVEEILTGEPQVVIIESTNSLLVNATAEQHAQIALIIGYVDSETERAAIPYVVYPLENQDPTELAGILNQLITETTQTQDQEGKIVSSTTTKLLEEDIVIIPDAKTYSLIVYASRKNQQWIGNIISQLDQYRPQVLLDCTLVEIFKNDDFQLAIDWIQAFPDLTEVSGKAFDPASVVLPQTRDRFIEFDASGSAFYGDEHVNFLLTAIQTKNFGRVLANPKILVNDNESGTITTQETQYIVRLESQVLAGASTGTSTTRSSVNFESYQAGITLQIEPHISKGRQLRLQISMIRSDFRETGPAKVTDPETGQVREIEKPPDTVTNDIQTVVTVPDGHTVILGGLEKLNQNKGGSKVPLLGDIPLIGGLFRKTSNTDLQNRLYIFVKAHILRPDEETAGLSDIEIVSLRNRKKFEKYEKEMQEYQDWPGIKPKPMDPISVLEEDDVK